MLSYFRVERAEPKTNVLQISKGLNFVSVFSIIFTVIQLLTGLFLIVVVLLQSGKSSGLSGAVSGSGAETFFSKGKSKSLDETLAKMTKWVGIVFVLMTLILTLLH